MRVLSDYLEFLIRVYQALGNPILPRTCRFTPSCSRYMIMAIREHGICKGIALGLWRLARCHPFCRGGFDPVRRRRPLSTPGV